VQSRRGYAEKLYTTPAEAMAALGAAVKGNNRSALAEIFGAHNLAKLMPPGPAADDHLSEAFARRFTESAVLEKKGETAYTVVLGHDHWAFPVPIIKEGRHWRFNTAAGIEAIQTQVIGENELSAVMACRAIVAAQSEYAASHDGSYAQNFTSQPGKKDGLYWITADGEAPSPLGAALANAAGDGDGGRTIAPYHGYYFRMLARQGPHAPGGRISYLANNRMNSGFALIAVPAQWGVSGIMTFIVNRDGRVYGVNFGLHSIEVVSDITEYDPDPTWTLIMEP
jgi:hypothetical protein